MSEANNEENGTPTKVIVVDDHSVTRQGVVLLCFFVGGNLRKDTLRKP